MKKSQLENLIIPTGRKVYNQSLYGNNLYFGNFKNEINQFLIIAITEIPNININTLCYNLKTLKIVLKPKVNFEDKVTAYYYPIPNQIEILDEQINKKDSYHELLHMSTCYKDVNNIRTGFAFTILKDNCWESYGIGLNEGYTALLENRYFQKFGGGTAYKIQQRIMNIIEYIIGKDNLEKYYFNADIESLINELKNYLPEERIIDLINITDFITLNNKISNLFLKKAIIVNTQELNNIIRELAFGYFDYHENIDHKLVELVNESTCHYYVYKNKKYPLKQNNKKYNP